MEREGHFVSFEWIGAENYLKEKVARGKQRTRGENFTSTDAAILLQQEDGSKQIVLIEWKYTESYGSNSYKIAKSGTDRTAIYYHLFERDDFPLNKSRLPSFDALFYEPFYQLLRQQCLGHEMQLAHELGAEKVTLLHITPAHNQDFPKVTSPTLKSIGETVSGVWEHLITEKDSFRSISTEKLFGSFPVEDYPQLQFWWEYITQRYNWLTTD
jgi:hypothetical protein